MIKRTVRVLISMRMAQPTSVIGSRISSMVTASRPGLIQRATKAATRMVKRMDKAF